MAELATIARPYAEALFQVSRTQAEATQAWLSALADAAGSEALLRFAANPKVNAEQVFQVVSGALKSPLPEQGANFLRAVIENGRLAALPEVARQYRGLVNGLAGKADALIQSAFPLDASQLNALLADLQARFGHKLEPKVEVNPSLIGGVRVVIGDEVLDTSVKARLEQMKMALTA